MAGLLIVALSVTACTSEPGRSTSSPSDSPSGTSASTPVPATPSGGSSTPATTSTPPTTGGDGPSPVAGTASPVVTYSGYDATSGQIRAAGYVDGVQQSGAGADGGTCVLTVTGPGGVTATGSQPATADATTTQCGTVSVTLSARTAGSWSGVLSYSSATAAGSSPTFTVEVTP